MTHERAESINSAFAVIISLTNIPSTPRSAPEIAPERDAESKSGGKP